MLEKKPKISIITIVYNNVRDIRYTLASVAKQDYPNIEYIIVDGLSTLPGQRRRGRRALQAVLAVLPLERLPVVRLEPLGGLRRGRP